MYLHVVDDHCAMACTSLVVTSSLRVSVVLRHLDGLTMVYEDIDDKVYDCLW